MLFLRGLIIGLSIAAPVGPIGVLCVRRTLAHGRMAGLVSGLGAATADAIYGCVAGLGLTAVSGLLVAQQNLLSLVGGAFLLFLGIRTLLAPPSAQSAVLHARGGRFGAYGSTLVLTLTNPVTILSFAAVFAGLGLAAAQDYGAALLLIGGVFVGSAAWWLTLSGVVSLVRDRFDLRAMLWVNRLSGAVIATFGLAALASAVL